MCVEPQASPGLPEAKASILPSTTSFYPLAAASVTLEDKPGDPQALTQLCLRRSKRAPAPAVSSLQLLQPLITDSAAPSRARV